MATPRWKTTEVDYLKENYGNIDIAKMSTFLNRTVNAIQWKASSLGISFKKDSDYFLRKEILKLNFRIDEMQKSIDKLLISNGNHQKRVLWDSDNDSELIMLRETNSIQDLMLIYKCGYSTICNQLKRLGILKLIFQPTEKQIEFVLENYKKMTGKEIASFLNISTSSYVKIVNDLTTKGVLQRKNKKIKKIIMATKKQLKEKKRQTYLKSNQLNVNLIKKLDKLPTGEVVISINVKNKHSWIVCNSGRTYKSLHTMINNEMITYIEFENL